MLADVLWDAANVNLQPPGEGFSCVEDVWSQSCCAVAVAANVRWGTRESLHSAAEKSPVFAFLKGLGCNTRSSLLYEDQDDPQGVRYMWLLLAMHVAEDEGIEV